eukprot:1161943-Pelagomonas_calceolata.AAC.8
MASQAPSSSSNPLARWLKHVTPAQHLLETKQGLPGPRHPRRGSQLSRTPRGVLQVTARLMLFSWAP